MKLSYIKLKVQLFQSNRCYNFNNILRFIFERFYFLRNVIKNTRAKHAGKNFILSTAWKQIPCQKMTYEKCLFSLRERDRISHLESTFMKSHLRQFCPLKKYIFKNKTNQKFFFAPLFINMAAKFYNPRDSICNALATQQHMIELRKFDLNKKQNSRFCYIPCQ